MCRPSVLIVVPYVATAWVTACVQTQRGFSLFFSFFLYVAQYTKVLNHPSFLYIWFPKRDFLFNTDLLIIQLYIHLAILSIKRYLTNVVSTYNGQLDKEPISNCIFRHFVTSTLPHPPPPKKNNIICYISLVKSMKNTKQQADMFKIVFLH